MHTLAGNIKIVQGTITHKTMILDENHLEEQIMHYNNMLRTPVQKNKIIIIKNRDWDYTDAIY